MSRPRGRSRGRDALDAQTFESWLLGATASEPARALFRLIAQVVFCVEPGQLSLLNLLHYAAAGEGIAHMLGTRGGAQDSLFEGGAWQLAARMAEGLGDAVVIECAGAVDRPDRRRGDGHVGRRRLDGGAGRGDRCAVDGGADLLHPPDAPAPRRAHPARADGQHHQGARRL